MHTEERFFNQCQLSEKKFGLRGGITKHERRHKEEKVAVKCNYCEKNYLSQLRLKEQEGRLMDDKPFLTRFVKSPLLFCLNTAFTKRAME